MCLPVICVAQDLAGPIWFSFAVKFLIGPGEVYKYFGGG